MVWFTAKLNLNTLSKVKNIKNYAYSRPKYNNFLKLSISDNGCIFPTKKKNFAKWQNMQNIHHRPLPTPTTFIYSLSFSLPHSLTHAHQHANSSKTSKKLKQTQTCKHTHTCNHANTHQCTCTYSLTHYVNWQWRGQLKEQYCANTILYLKLISFLKTYI